VRNVTLVGLVLVALAAAASGAVASPGDLDAGFGSAGVALLPPPAGYLDSTHIVSVSVAPDGVIAVAGNAYKAGGGSDLVVGRLTPAGKPDPVFNGGHLMPVASSFNGIFAAGAVVALPGGRTLVAAPTGELDDTTLLLARLKADGSLDSGFGAGGLVHFKAAGTADSIPTAMRVLTDGRIVVAGFVRAYSSGGVVYTRFLLARFLPGGQPDRSLAGVGYTLRSIDPSQFQDAHGLALEASGRATLAGNQDLGGLVARYQPDGTADSSFGFGGFIGPGDENTSLAGADLPGDGSTIVAGDSAGWPYAARIQPGPAGPAATGYLWRSLVKGSARGADVTGVVTDSGGRAMMVGTGSLYATQPNGLPGPFVRSDAMLVVLDGAGALDPVVGGSPPGFRFYPVPGHRTADFRAVAAAPGGRLVLAGTVQPDVGDVFHAAVLRVQAPPPTTSGASGGGPGSQQPTRPGPGLPTAAAPRARISALRRAVTIDLRTGRGSTRVKCEAAPGDVCRLKLGLKPRRGKRVALGRVRGTLSGGRSGKVSVQLSRLGLARLRHAPRRRLAVLASGTSRNRAGASVTVKRTLRLTGRRRSG
jgi:uncharacterized delta-60 repeat protein